jgi:predicted lipoprotein with Yx(FWY)xxD motif
MTRNRSLITLTAVALVALVIAGCGSSGGGGSSGASASASPPTMANGAAASVGLANTGLGKVLVDGRGRTLYLFKADTGTTSTCTGACATNWPPLRASGKPTVGNGLQASLVGTTNRPGGQMQLTYSGHPLYRFVGDQKPGDTSGQGITAFGAPWFAVTASGAQASGAATSTGGGNGY